MHPVEELRAAALEARRALEAILDGDRGLVDRVAADLDAALALPLERAGRALRAALSIDERVRRWALGLVAAVPAPLVRLPGPGPDALTPLGAGGSGDPAGAGPRVLRAQTQERVESGRVLTVRVDIATAGDGIPLPGLDVPDGGAEVLVRVSAPSLEPRGELQKIIVVPRGRDSDPVLFEFAAGAPGLHPMRVEAYRQGTFLGGVRLQVSVESAAVPAIEGPVRSSRMSTVAFEPGEVTLIVERSGDGYRFQLLGASTYRPVQAAMGTADAAAAAIVTELTDLAAGRSPYGTVSAVARRLRNLGVALWGQAVPGTVQEQFWAEIDRIGSFTIIADDADFPFELLYPLSREHDNGFLVEQFPVVRRALDTGRVATLALRNAAYLLSHPAPSNARAEIARIQELLGTRVAASPVITTLDGVQDALLGEPGLLHLACHNEFVDTEGSWVPLDGGPWKPSDLAPAALTGALAGAAPLVFFNACRSAGQVSGMSAMSGWAEQFMRAGAGAFVGSLWAVRSPAARAFAEAFYAALVDDGHSLGGAALTARRTIARDAGDPTWLAYTVYGNPASAFAG